MQNGSLMQTPSRRGPNVWEYRWRAGAGWEEIIGPITSLGRAAIAISTPAAAKAGIGKTHLQAHVFDSSTRSRDGAGSTEGTSTPFRYSNNAEHLHSSRHLGQTRSGVEGGGPALENVNLYEFVLLPNALPRLKSFGVLVRLAGFEPATFCSGAERPLHHSLHAFL